MNITPGPVGPDPGPQDPVWKRSNPRLSGKQMILLDWLVKRYPHAKRQTLKRMVQSGRVRIGDRRARTLRDQLPDRVTVRVVDENPSKKVATEVASPSGFSVVLEDRDILVVNKPEGLLTSTTPREPRETLLALVQKYLSRSDPEARVGLIHRLDRDASGLLIFSKNDSAYRNLKTQFFHHNVTRQYLAVVHGKPNPDRRRIRTRLVKRADGTIRSTDEHAAGKGAITEYETIATRRKMSLLRVTLLTGKKHQIRVHLAERGTPIVGDRVYGKKDDTAPRLMLTAVLLTIAHPRTGEKIKFELPPPAEFPISPSDR